MNLFWGKYCFFLIKLIISIFILTGAIVHTAMANECFVAAPYVLHVDHQSGQVIWVTPSGTDAGEVHIGAVGGDQEKTVTAELTTPRFQDRNSDEGELDYLRQLVQIDNLKPFTEYHYEVQCGDGETTSNGRFRTSPVPGESKPFEFVAVADGHAMNRYRQISEPVGELLPSFVVHVGDMRGGRGHDWDRWENYFDVARPYLESSVFLPVVGGHDVRPARNFRSLFAFNDPQGDPSREDNAGTYYTMTYGNLLVVVLDHVYELEEQLEWLEKVLSQNQAEWIMVFSHASFASIGGNGAALRGWYFDFARIFEKYGVDMVITAHDHIYERRLPFGSEGVKPVHHITINSNGNHRRLRPSPIVEGGIAQRAYMYSHFSLNGNRLEMKSVDHEGNVIDRFELIKDNLGMYQNEVMAKAVDLELARTLSHIYTGQSMEEDLRYERRDINGKFKSGIPNAGETTELTLNTGYTGTSEFDNSRFPIGSELIVYKQTDPSLWRTENQIIEITGNAVDVKVTAPDNLTSNEEGLDPHLELDVNIRVDGRDFEPVTIRPTLVETGEINKVEIISPSQNQTVSDKPKFSWEDQLQVQEYQFQLGSPDLDSLILDTIITDNEIIYPDHLQSGKSYVWRVRGLNEFEGPWSEEVVFHVQQIIDSEDLDPVSFSDNLIPAAQNMELSDVSLGSMGRGFRGNNSMFTWLWPDASLSLKVTGGTISHYQDRGNIKFELIETSNVDIVDSDASVPPDGETYEIELESPFNGLHELDWDDGNDRTYLEWPEGLPMSVRASKEHPFQFQRDFYLYFYVPEGTSEVSGYASLHSNTRFFDSDGKEMTGWQNVEDNEGYFIISVPQGQDSTLWSVEADRNVTLSLQTVPPYLARSGEELLLPKELFEIEDISTSSERTNLTTQIELDQNYPNPFNPETQIRFALPEQAHVLIEVYNIAGQRVKTILNEVKQAGRHEVMFDASNLSSGVYLYRLQSGSHVKSRQMLLIK